MNNKRAVRTPKKAAITVIQSQSSSENSFFEPIVSPHRLTQQHKQGSSLFVFYTIVFIFIVSNF